MKDIGEYTKYLSQAVAARAGNPIWNYKPHKIQRAFHNSPAQCRFVFGGNRTGKSECGAVETVWLATGTHPNIPPSQTQGLTKPNIPPTQTKNSIVLDEIENGKLASSLPQTQVATIRTGTEVTPNNAAEISCWVVSLTRQVQRDVAQAKILKYLPKEWIMQVVMLDGSAKSPEYGVIDFIIVQNKYGGKSKIGFRNCEQGRERFAGVSLDFIWFDEEPPKDIYDECLLRLLDRGGKHFATMTPLKGRSWVYDRIYNNPNPDIAIFTMSWADNPYLNENEIKKMESTLSPDVLPTRKYGRFMDTEGLVFPEFCNDNIVDPFSVNDMTDKYISIDPGYTNPTAILWACSDAADNIYIVADYEVAKEMVETHATEIKRRTGELGWTLNETKILIDSASNQRTAGCSVSVAEQYKNNGIVVNTNVDKTIFDGVMAVKSLFCNANGERRLYVFRNCTHLIDELRGYFWGENDRPNKSADHTIDALRYLIMDIKRRTGNTKNKSLGVLGIAKRKILKKLRSNSY
ncbi:MAG: terminase family protein [Christensenellaceae bacterium]|jgi:phage terminase large subunit-like protein|nr:terminase family protein [Christensenellaceae bacterium]